MTEFNCQEKVLYRGSPVIIMGKRYGHVTDPKIGRMYDIKIGNRLLRDVAEKELRPIVEGYVSNGNGGALPIYGSTKHE